MVLVMSLVAVGCGRVGYDPIPLVGAGDGAAAVDASAPPPDAAADDQRPAPEPALDSGAPVAPDAGPERPLPADAPLDTTTPVPPDAASLDAAPLDAAADLVDAPPSCASFPAAGLIADFEDGRLNLNRVGTRGGRVFHLVDPELGTISNAGVSVCGQRSLQLQPIGTPPRAPIIQGQFALNQAGADPWLDARAYRGIALTFRASAPTAFRVKLPNADSTDGGGDHFQIALTAGPAWSQVSLAWGAFDQVGGGSATQFPTFRVDRLYAIEFSASLAPGASLWIDHITFTQ